MLLYRINKFLRHHRMAPARFGRDAVGDASFVFDLQNGREPRRATIARVDAFIARADHQLGL